ncbi:hypothetical protein KAU09_00445 [Candidatus Parcubacteria bacterium]|nr:hypothetical protein [Candidatus Parcubacteria bacterium]
MENINIGVLIYTYNRIEDAKISMEIIRNYWTKSSLINDIKIVHSFNGNKNWYPKKYLEDDLIRMRNSNHFQGASEMIDSGIKKMREKYKNLDYVIVLASDTWLVKINYLESLLKKMRKKELYLATCPWGISKRNSLFDVGISVDFFIMDFKWIKKYKMFPIDYKNFFDKYWELFLYVKGSNVFLEKLMIARFLEAIFKQYNNNVTLRSFGESKILNLKDRSPVHSHVDKNGFWIRKKYWPKMGLLTHHEPLLKQKILKQMKIDKGKYICKLISSNNLNYYLKYTKETERYDE